MFTKLHGGCRVGKVTEYASDSEKSLTVFHSTPTHTLCYAPVVHGTITPFHIIAACAPSSSGILQIYS